jgi:hypothetical protein
MLEHSSEPESVNLKVRECISPNLLLPVVWYVNHEWTVDENESQPASSVFIVM